MPGSMCGYVVRANSGTPVNRARIVGSLRIMPSGNREPVASAMAPHALSRSVSVRETAGHYSSRHIAQITTLTDRFGRFTFDDLYRGTYVIQVAGPLDEPLGEATVHVFDNALSDVTIQVSSPANGTGLLGSIHGRVMRAQNRMPVANATIVVRGACSAPDIAPLTDGAGWFLLDGLSAGEWVLRALGPDGEIGEATVQVLAGSVAEIVIRVTASGRMDMVGSIHGRVIRGENRKPIPNAAITVVRGAGSAPDIAPLTDEAGWFLFDGLPAGEWVLRALGPDGETGEATVRVSADSVAETVISAIMPSEASVPESN